MPERFTKTYLNWMENVHDWCISRQLWWGHQIPAWYCADCGHITVSREDATECECCHSKHITRDEDVLDTWFSSALWPFSTMGWPEKTDELNYWYPTSVMITGYDIIFFWVARMIFSGMEQMDKEPFKTVFIHGLVRDSQGRKMSKSLGNGIDPLEMVEKYGADALRYQPHHRQLPRQRYALLRREVRSDAQLLQQALERIPLRDDEPHDRQKRAARKARD